jgi:hypothetical protein
MTGLFTPAAGADDLARNNGLLNAFRIAVNGGLSVQNMQDGIVDEFEDETGVDTGTSTNETYDGTDDHYSNPGGQALIAQGTGTAIGDMTVAGGLAAAFDSTTVQAIGSCARSGNAAAAYVGKDWGGGTTYAISQVIWYGPSDAGIFETDTTNRIRIQESATGAWGGEEATIGDAGTFDGSANGVVKTITCSGATEKRYHRALIDGGSGSEKAACAEVEFYETNTPPDMTLIANAVTAEAEPATARLVLFEQDVDAVTVNTDLIASVSRDGGITWSAVTLADEGDYETGQRILAGTVDVSGQPSGTSMLWKAVTANDKELKLHGVALQWAV